MDTSMLDERGSIDGMDIPSDDLACILCGNGGPLGPEHIWPTWYSNMRRGLKFGFDGTIAGKPHTTRRVQKFDLAPEVLCYPCNNEWGSRLEVAASRLLKPMIDGKVQTLSGPSLATLARWATLKFMVSEYLSEDRSTFHSTEDRSYLRRRNRPPAGTTLWIGRYVGDFHLAGRYDDRRTELSLSTDDSELVMAWAAQLTIGQVVIQLFALGDHDRISQLPGLQVQQSRADWGASMYQLWPVPERPYNWPPPRALDDAGFKALSHRWDQVGEDDLAGAATPQRSRS